MRTQRKQEEKGGWLASFSRFSCLWTLLAVLALYVVVPVTAMADSSSSAAKPASDDNMPDCPDKDLATLIVQARRAAETADLGAQEEIKNDTLEAQAKNPTRISDIWNGYCLKAEFSNFFKNLINLLSGLDQFILGLILQLVEQLLEQVCSWINDAIHAVLEMVCLPISLPSLPSFSLGGIGGQTCNGISLNDLITVSAGKPVTFPAMPKNDRTMILKVPAGQTIFKL